MPLNQIKTNFHSHKNWTDNTKTSCVLVFSLSYDGLQSPTLLSFFIRMNKLIFSVALCQTEENLINNYELY